MQKADKERLVAELSDRIKNTETPIAAHDRGHTGAAGEVGHVQVDSNGERAAAILREFNIEELEIFFGSCN